MKKRVLAAFLSMAMVAGLATGCGTPGGGKLRWRFMLTEKYSVML